jgi:23S rRNA G2069 N7-methylase RlmK/C1962 C5-methylase RlmI
VRADVLQWLAGDAAADGGPWDLAVVDPPTFSNSKKMRASFDVQRDHAALLRSVYARLRPRAVVYFSTNARRFKPAPEAFAGLARVEEVSHDTVPPDFRDRKAHRAWRLELP